MSNFKETVKTTKLVVDTQTGEILNEEQDIYIKEFSITKSKEEFWIMYTSFISVMLGESKPSAIGSTIFYWLLNAYPGVTAGIAITKTLKDMMAKDLNISSGAISNNLPSLIKAKLIIKIDKGVYIINPKYVYKGNLKDRELLINIMLKSNKQ